MKFSYLEWDRFLKLSQNQKTVLFFYKLFHLSGVGQHKLYAVFLVDSCSTGVIVYGNYIAFGVIVFNFSYHTLAYNVVWQTAKWLSTNNIWGTRFNQL